MRVQDVGAETLSKNWWAVLLRGLAAIAFGLATLFAPGISIAALIILFGAYALVDGLLAIISAVRRRGTHDRWGLLVLEGIVGVGAAVFTVLWPGLTVLSLLFIIAGWAIVTGVLEISSAIVLRKQITGEWLLVLSGVASVVFGVVLFLFPAAGAVAIALLIGSYALVFGLILVGLAFRLRSWIHGHASRPMPHPA
jgi:uncharacterized membrane protein HdeD (DUF308 family)